jgi:hypothetical protein
MEYKYLRLLLSCTSGRDGDHGGGSRLADLVLNVLACMLAGLLGFFERFLFDCLLGFFDRLFVGLLAGIFLSV